MAATLWGKKIGMTQLFNETKVIPVTVVDIAHWVVTNLKTKERDGYNAIQASLLRDRFAKKSFDAQWLKKPSKYFLFTREINVGEDISAYTIGNAFDPRNLIKQGDIVDIMGKTKGHGFAGVVRRHGFRGAPASHGSNMGKRPGSSSSYRSQGRIIKGKRFPGHMGCKNQMMKNLEVIKIDSDANVVLIKGSFPGKAGSLVSIRKNNG